MHLQFDLDLNWSNITIFRKQYTCELVDESWFFVWKCSQVYAKLVKETYRIEKKAYSQQDNVLLIPPEDTWVHQRRENEPQCVSSLSHGGVFIIPLLCNHLSCQFISPLFQVRVEKEKVIIRANKQVKRLSFSGCVKRVVFNSSCEWWCGESSVSWQALQTQRRSKAMSKCSAVINSSSGFSHVLIIGSGCRHNVIKWD